jgi:endonuclease/exonuclease/phosphatase family metal-dependent hydrolase
VRVHSPRAQISLLGSGESWWLKHLRPQTDGERIQFLDELRAIRSACTGTWMVCGDFNIIYQARDKNNHRLNRRMMGRFRRFIDDMEFIDLHLKGRLDTWSSEREAPTLERLDRVLVTNDWAVALPDHELSVLASECSDHAPLLLRTDVLVPAALQEVLI